MFQLKAEGAGRMVSLVDSDGSAVNYTLSAGSDLPLDLPQQFVTTIGGQEITLVQQPDGEDRVKFVQVWRFNVYTQ
jgi:hypothetical protein